MPLIFSHSDAPLFAARVSRQPEELTMAETLVPATESEPANVAQAVAGDTSGVITADLLVEEVSIDGMCGVY
jgi:mycofactocin precursor